MHIIHEKTSNPGSARMQQMLVYIRLSYGNSAIQSSGRIGVFFFFDLTFIQATIASTFEGIQTRQNPRTAIVVSGGFGAKIESRLCQILLQMLIRTPSKHALAIHSFIFTHLFCSISDQVQTGIALVDISRTSLVLCICIEHRTNNGSMRHWNSPCSQLP